MRGRAQRVGGIRNRSFKCRKVRSIVLIDPDDLKINPCLPQMHPGYEVGVVLEDRRNNPVPSPEPRPRATILIASVVFLVKTVVP